MNAPFTGQPRTHKPQTKVRPLALPIFLRTKARHFSFLTASELEEIVTNSIRRIRRFGANRPLESMSSIGTGYDLSVTTFSPDGRVFQIEYAAKAVDNSGYVHQRIQGEEKAQIFTVFIAIQDPIQISFFPDFTTTLLLVKLNNGFQN